MFRGTANWTYFLCDTNTGLCHSAQYWARVSPPFLAIMADAVPIYIQDDIGGGSIDAEGTTLITFDRAENISVRYLQDALSKQSHVDRLFGELAEKAHEPGDLTMHSRRGEIRWSKVGKASSEGGLSYTASGLIRSHWSIERAHNDPLTRIEYRNGPFRYNVKIPPALVAIHKAWRNQALRESTRLDEYISQSGRVIEALDQLLVYGLNPPSGELLKTIANVDSGLPNWKVLLAFISSQFKSATSTITSIRQENQVAARVSEDRFESAFYGELTVLNVHSVLFSASGNAQVASSRVYIDASGNTERVVYWDLYDIAKLIGCV